MQWGLIGASTIAAEWMIRAIRAQSGQNVKSIMSADAHRACAFAAEHGIEGSTDDLGGLLADPAISAVYISSTNEKHCHQAMAAIAAGKHIMCEKPLALTVGDAVKMTRAAREKGLVFATNHHLRSAGSHLAIRDLVASGRIGRVLSVRVFHAVLLAERLHGWRVKSSAAGGGVILDIAVHDVDTVRFHLGEDPVSVLAVAGASGLGEGVEDSSMSLLSMPSGAMVHTHESFTHPHAGDGFELHGTEGSIIAHSVMRQMPAGEIRLVDRSGSSVVPFAKHDMCTRSLKLFSEAVAGRGKPAADGVDGVKSLAVALAMRDAAKCGAAVKVDYGGS